MYIDEETLSNQEITELVGKCC